MSVYISHIAKVLGASSAPWLMAARPCCFAARLPSIEKIQSPTEGKRPKILATNLSLLKPTHALGCTVYIYISCLYMYI